MFRYTWLSVENDTILNAGIEGGGIGEQLRSRGVRRGIEWGLNWTPAGRRTPRKTADVLKPGAE